MLNIILGRGYLVSRSVPNYNLEIRRRLSDEYVLVGKQIEVLKSEQTYLMCRQIHPDQLTHMEFMTNESRLEQIAEDLVLLDYARKIWDRAREICMEVIDEVSK